MFNVALFGFGRIGQLHAQNIHDSKQFKLYSVYEKSKKLALLAKKRYLCNIPLNKKDIFADKKIDIIFISSPTNTHIDLIEESIRSKKIVFCEKPIDLNIKKVERTLKKVKNNKLKIQLGFNRRYDPGHFNLKKLLNKNKIGKLEKIIITSRDPSSPSLSYLKSSGGIFKDMMIHDFDMCRFFLGNDSVREITANASCMESKFKKIKDYELATTTLKSKKGVICVITNSRHCSFGYDQRIELFGTGGMLISNNKRVNEIEFHSKKNTSSKNRLLNFFIDRYYDAYKLQLNDLYKLAKSGEVPRSTFYDGYEALKIAYSAIKSFKEKKTVIIKK
tara:strand:+ start:708 stop:1706 length:999 start_codon:yes stop_codon:yes gene_type:complete